MRIDRPAPTTANVADLTVALLVAAIVAIVIIAAIEAIHDKVVPQPTLPPPAYVVDPPQENTCPSNP